LELEREILGMMMCVYMEERSWHKPMLELDMFGEIVQRKLKSAEIRFNAEAEQIAAWEEGWII